MTNPSPGEPGTVQRSDLWIPCVPIVILIFVVTHLFQRVVGLERRLNWPEVLVEENGEQEGHRAQADDGTPPFTIRTRQQQRPESAGGKDGTTYWQVVVVPEFR